VTSTGAGVAAEHPQVIDSSTLGVLGVLGGKESAIEGARIRRTLPD